MDSCSFRWPTWPEGNTEKNYLVHIATSLRHHEFYGKKAYHLPSGAAVGSVHSWVRVDILESHSGLVQLSETIYHRESNPQPTKTSMDHWNLSGRHISVYFAAKRLQFKRKTDSLIDLLILDDFFCHLGTQRARHGKGWEHRSLSHRYKKRKLQGELCCSQSLWDSGQQKLPPTAKPRMSDMLWSLSTVIQ